MKSRILAKENMSSDKENRNFLLNWNEDDVKVGSKSVISRVSTSSKKSKDVDEKVIAESVKDIMAKGFIDYSKEVITNRTFPSSLDGLIPVQRRFLYQGFLDKLKPTGSYVKSSKWTSSVMSVIHPHGDASIYNSIANQARNWTRVKLVDGKGNFGLTYGDEPAAMRYTQARISEFGWSMVEDLAYNAVPMVTSEDHDTVEPKFLPTRFPNLIINGGDGIGIGYSTKTPQHNPVEAMDVVEAMLKNPDITIDEIIDLMPGPDWSTGGEVVARNDREKEGIKSYYSTGRGTIRIRSTAKFDGGNIILTSIPHGTSPESIISKIHSGIMNSQFEEIKYAKDLSSEKNGTMIEIAVKRGYSPQNTFSQLCSSSVGIESTFSVNMNVLDHDKVLRGMNIKDVFREFIWSRYEVLKNVTNNAIEKDTAQKHLLEGMAKILLDIDKAISIIRNSDNAASAKTKLMSSFSIDDIQADYILGLTLRRLTKQDSVEVSKKIKELAREIKNNQEILGSKIKQRNIIIKQVQDTREIFKSHPDVASRKTKISNTKVDKKKPTVSRTTTTKTLPSGQWGIDPSGYLSNNGENINGGIPFAVLKGGDVKIFNGKGLPKNFSQPIPIVPNPDDILVSGVAPKGSFILFVTRSGKVLKVDPSSINGQGISGNGVAGIKFKDEDDALVSSFTASDDDNILTISDDGWKVTPVSDIPVKGRGGYGVMIHKLRSNETGVYEATSGSGFKVNSKSAEPTPRPKSTNKGSVSSWMVS